MIVERRLSSVSNRRLSLSDGCHCGGPTDGDTLGRFVVNLFRSYFILLLFTIGHAEAKALPGIYWNSTNEIFRIDNTDHVFSVRIGDRIDFICPYLNPRVVSPVADVEVLKIHSVSQWAYDYCALTGNSTVVGVCGRPFQLNHMTVVFREYTPKPGGLEFRPGRSYYFITTSTGRQSGLDNTSGGLCLSKNMKVKFEVQPSSSSSTVQDSSWQSSHEYGRPAVALDSETASDGGGGSNHLFATSNSLVSSIDSQTGHQHGDRRRYQAAASSKDYYAQSGDRLHRPTSTTAARSPRSIFIIALCLLASLSFSFLTH